MSYPARFDGRGDRFVALYLGLAIDGRGQSRSDAARAGRAIAALFARPQVIDALAADPDELRAQLADGARLYFESCLSDGHYGSSLFGLKRLTREQVRGKIERDRQAMIAIVEASGAADELARLVLDGLRDGFEATVERP